MHKLEVFFLACVVALLPHSTAFAQPAPASASGVVVDQSGGVVPRAEVELRDRNGTVVARTAAGNDGRFLFRGLSPGAYTVSVRLAPFRTAQRARRPKS